MDRAEREALTASGPSTVILINNDGMGSAEEALRHKLLRVYLTMLLENRFYPGAICFYAGGVKMVVDGSPVLELLRELETKGVRLIICSTCLQYFGLTEKVAAGIVGGMGDIVLAQWMASKVITL
jgi:intracellular sulfur oxidation DsrE/DsrF family protein